MNTLIFAQTALRDAKLNALNILIR